MLSHESVWAAIDKLADMHGLSPSGLARRAGLDPTSFNKSKRGVSAERLRWPSTESIAKALKATGTPLDAFMALIVQSGETPKKAENATRQYRQQSRPVPLLGFAQAGVGGFFDDGGFPAGHGWEEIDFPSQGGDGVYALKVTGDSMLPLYRQGDVIIVAPGAAVHKGDKVVVRTREGEVMAKILSRRTAKQVELASVNPDHEMRVIPAGSIDWIARILWASQ